MRIFRAYAPLQPADFIGTITLSIDASHHLATVLRANQGDIVHLFDGHGHRFEGRITGLGKQLAVQILQALPSNSESALTSRLLIAVGKGDKMDWIVQKATELGVTNIQPFISKRCAVQLSKERWQKKQNHWQTIVINACEQSGRDFVPDVGPICSFDSALQMANNQLNLLLHPGEGGKRLPQLLANTHSKEITMLIGPEGGFAEDEVIQAQARGFQLASLGPRILRMETAAIASITLVQALLGDI